MKIPHFGRLAALFLCLTALASPVPVRAADAPRKIVTVEGVTEYRLANGLRVLTLPAPSQNSVTVHITYLVGSRQEGYGEKGMAHMLEHMLFRGSTHFPDIKDQFTRRGASWNGTTSYDRTNYFETLPAGQDNLDWALAMEADRMIHSFISRADLDREMTVVRNEFEMGQNSPENVLTERMQRLAFAWHNYGDPVIGTRSDIERVPVKRLQAFYRTWYRPDNAVLIVAGRFDEQHALEQVSKTFGAIPRPAEPMPSLYTVEPTQDGERTVTLRRAGDTQLVASMYRVPAAAHPDFPAIDVLVSVLGRVPDGRLYQALVRKGLASYVSETENALHDPGFVVFRAGLTRTASMQAARDALLRTVEHIDDDPVRADEVERARKSLLNDFDRTRIDSAAFVSALSEFSALGDWRLLFLYRDRLASVTLADVQRVAGTYFKRSNRVLGTFIPTSHPDRAEIPATPDYREALARYGGGHDVAEGERFDATPAHIDARTVRRSIANGIRLALLPKKSRGRWVTADLMLHWGNERDRTGRATACSLANAMIMRGTSRHTRAQLRDELDKLNASVSAGIYGAHVEARSDKFPAALRLAAEMLREPSFPAGEFDELKRSWLTGIEARRHEPGAVAGIDLARHLKPYPKGHPYYTETLDEQLRNLEGTSLKDVRACYRDLVGATGADFAAVGDFDPDALAREVAQLFGDWKSPRPYTRVVSRYFNEPAYSDQLRTPDKANAVLRAGLNIEMRDDDPDYPALSLAAYLLGGSSTSRLPARVRERDGLSYSTYAWLDASAFDRSATLGISSIYAPQNKDRVERAIREELERALRDGFSEKEVREGIDGVLKERQLARSDDQNLSYRLAGNLHRERTFAWDAQFDRRIAALSAREVSAALRRYVDPAHLSIVTAGDFQRAQPAAGASAPGLGAHRAQPAPAGSSSP